MKCQAAMVQTRLAYSNPNLNKDDFIIRKEIDVMAKLHEEGNLQGNINYS